MVGWEDGGALEVSAEGRVCRDGRSARRGGQVALERRLVAGGSRDGWGRGADKRGRRGVAVTVEAELCWWLSCVPRSAVGSYYVQLVLCLHHTLRTQNCMHYFSFYNTESEIHQVIMAN